MTIVLQVFKWDDDLAVVLPQELIDQLALKEGDDLEILAASESQAERDAIHIGAPGHDESRHKGR